MNAMAPLFSILAYFLCFSAMAATPSVQADGGPGATPESEVMESSLGFKDWKQKRVFTARAQLDAFKAPKLESPPADSTSLKEDQENVENSEENPEQSEPLTAVEAKEEPKNQELAQEQPSEQESQALEEKLRQLEFNLEIAQGLTIHDYFALYLKDKSKQELAAVIEKLSPDELSELLLAYRTSLYGQPTPQGSEKQPLQ